MSTFIHWWLVGKLYNGWPAPLILVCRKNGISIINCDQSWWLDKKCTLVAVAIDINRWLRWTVNDDNASGILHLRGISVLEPSPVFSSSVMCVIDLKQSWPIFQNLFPCRQTNTLLPRCDALKSNLPALSSLCFFSVLPVELLSTLAQQQSDITGECPSVKSGEIIQPEEEKELWVPFFESPPQGMFGLTREY